MKDCLNFLGSLLVDSLYHPGFLRPDLPYWGDFFALQSQTHWWKKSSLRMLTCTMPIYATLTEDSLWSPRRIWLPYLKIKQSSIRKQQWKLPRFQKRARIETVGTSTGTNDPVANRPDHRGEQTTAYLTVLRLQWRNLNHSDVQQELANPLTGITVKSMYVLFFYWFLFKTERMWYSYWYVLLLFDPSVHST